MNYIKKHLKLYNGLNLCIVYFSFIQMKKGMLDQLKITFKHTEKKGYTKIILALVLFSFLLFFISSCAKNYKFFDTFS